jgi:UDP-N-acetylmuramate--alanine ligase
MDADHLDIYHTSEAMEEAFLAFAEKTKSTGFLIRKTGLPRLDAAKVSKQYTYHLIKLSGSAIPAGSIADISSSNVRNKDYGYQFDVSIFGECITDFELNVGGLHNIENMTVAIAICSLLGIDKNAIKDAVKAYAGVKRRFELIVKGGNNVIFIDDYAHHPGELEALLKSVRGMYPSKKITILFQPHLYSRTRDFADGFAQSLSMADEALLLPIYPARELPMEGVSSNMIAEKMKHVTMISKDEVLEWIDNNVVEVFITAGAGDIDALVQPIKQAIENKYAC